SETGPTEIALRLASGRFDQTETVPLTVFVNDQEVGQVDVRYDFHTYTLSLPEALSHGSGAFAVRLESGTWELNKVQLGVQVDWIALSDGAG
nr:hypothetical protein [Dehalococcoidales bacterium]